MDKIEQELSMWFNPDQEIETETRLVNEVSIGSNILRWARQGFLKIDYDAINDFMGEFR